MKYAALILTVLILSACASNGGNTSDTQNKTKSPCACNYEYQIFNGAIYKQG